MSDFFGVKGEGAEDFGRYVHRIIDSHRNHRQSLFPEDSFEERDGKVDQRFEDEFSAMIAKIKDEIPYFHPRYFAQMIRDPSLAGLLGYISYLISNPNNHAYEGGPVTTMFEIEVEQKF